MSSLVSLVMTVYNRENYLSQALDSILAQTYSHWHLTIWDDGSTDSSPAIAKHYARLDSRIHFIQASHAGATSSLAAAMKTIVRHCPVLPNLDLAETSESMYRYFAWVDSDDLLAPTALAKTVNILDKKPEIGMVYTDYHSIDPIGRDLGLGTRCQIPYSKERLLIDFMTFHFRLIRWEIYDAIGGIDLAFTQAHDYDVCLKISEVTEIYHYPQPLYYYRLHPTMVSRIQQTVVVACAAMAVRNALVRRGLSDRYRLNVTPDNRFKLEANICYS
jgi:glycosyltransferase involved in cell wall biosynthesis